MSVLTREVRKAIEDVLSEYTENDDRSKFPGMSYEEGLRDALDLIDGNITVKEFAEG